MHAATTQKQIMQVKGMDGGTYSVTGQGQGNLNTVLGALGAAGTLSNGNLLGNLLGGIGNNYQRGPVEVVTSEDKPVSRHEAKMMQELGAKDSEIALLKADKYTDQKIVEATSYLQGEIRRVEDIVRQNKDAQVAINMEQAVYNGTNTSALNCLRSQVAQLASLSELVVPQSRVCNTGCGCQQ